MKSNDVIRIAVADSSVIIRSGLALTLKRLPRFKILTIEVASREALNDCLRTHPPHILFVNPAFGDYFDVARFKSDPVSKGVRVIALVNSLVDSLVLNKYDETISIFDGPEILSEKIGRLQDIKEEEEEESETLSQREKEIVVCVVKGMTNKEIAENLFLSIHTVITHRRNISRKLRIHSAAGLTIYAIVNKLVELGDVKGL
ncbi:response regulator transcription factor [Bacteroides sp. OttesenSCG-928-J23]|nr:response regulator transcription factor [Bacteroides sp. OttesenSCG-928-J23]MDL2291904.1 response regulator transcription factor [Bacteroides sp. OttesenSCG-928-F21]